MSFASLATCLGESFRGMSHPHDQNRSNKKFEFGNGAVS